MKGALLIADSLRCASLRRDMVPTSRRCDSEVTVPDDMASVDPEAMCVNWSTKSCAAISGCCQGEDHFDSFLCEAVFSGYCLDNLKLELAHSDQYVVDAAAVQECLTPLSECGSSEPSQLHPVACSNMLTGYRPLGAGCSLTADCLRPSKGRAVCYFGEFSSLGVCANIVESTNGKCSFSKETLIYSTCPENMYCDQYGVQMPSGEIPSDFTYEFEANCKPDGAIGESCVLMDDTIFDVLPCQKGLYCNIDKVDPAASKCQPFKKIGEPCSTNAPIECEEIATCDYVTGKCVQDEEIQVPFCYAPIVCGDGECSSNENYATCNQDCGICGDGMCSADEKGNCPDDCPVCGDESCSGDEPNTCPADCKCVGCATYVNDQMGMLCVPSQPIFLLLSQCLCAGACADVCSDNFCNGAALSFECEQCSQDVMNGCGKETGACSSDP